MRTPTFHERAREARHLVVLTGAGVSAESGIPTFRGADGLWRRHRAEDLATPEAFARDPQLVWEWYDWRRQLIATCRPNPAHEAIAALEARAQEFLLITQNVDGLHRQAGSRRLVELHGSVWRVRCLAEGTLTENLEVPLPSLPPRCACGALLRPDVVWFGETPYRMDEITRLLVASALFLSIGTSGHVYPAAGFAALARKSGARTVELNLEPSEVASDFDEAIYGRATEVVPAYVEKLLKP